MKNLIKNPTITIKKPTIKDVLNSSEKLAKGVSKVSSIAASLALSCIIIDFSFNVIHNHVGRPLLKKFGKNVKPRGAHLVIVKHEKVEEEPVNEEVKEGEKLADKVVEDVKKD